MFVLMSKKEYVKYSKYLDERMDRLAERVGRLDEKMMKGLSQLDTCNNELMGKMEKQYGELFDLRMKIGALREHLALRVEYIEGHCIMK